ncbi:MAG: ferrous iron transport protein A [Oscillospiraceae bacterium]|nr:ferrous iron transport protein A [Oscillospiraceae bacterium]
MSENSTFTLNKLRQNKTGVVTELKNSGVIRRRLQDLGIIEGTRIECIGKSPLGDPKAYLIKGTLIALRNNDAEKIIVKSNV